MTFSKLGFHSHYYDPVSVLEMGERDFNSRFPDPERAMRDIANWNFPNASYLQKSNPDQLSRLFYKAMDEVSCMPNKNSKEYKKKVHEAYGAAVAVCIMLKAISFCENDRDADDAKGLIRSMRHNFQNITGLCRRLG